MGLFTPSRRATPRKFSYQPRYYDPRKDQKLKQRIRLKSRSRRNRGKMSGLIYFAVLLAFAFYIYNLLG